nr:MAG TPA: hypothetical protein [Caudoviricetes sp.]
MEDNEKIEEESLPEEDKAISEDAPEPSTPENENPPVQVQPKAPTKKCKGLISKIKTFVVEHPVETAAFFTGLFTLGQAVLEILEYGKDTPCENSASASAQASSNLGAPSVSEEIAAPVESPNETSEPSSREPITFPRKGCIVNMSDNRYPSAAKRAEAEEKGIPLGEHQTIRRDHECTR